MKTLKLDFSKKYLVRKAILIYAFGIATVFTISWSRDDDPAPVIPPLVLAPLQDPLAGYLTASGFNQRTFNIVNAGENNEFGFSFIPLVNGKITAIVAKIPDVNAGMRVTVWDKAAETALLTEVIEMTTPGIEVTKQITPLDLVKGRVYLISFNSDDWYDRSKSNGRGVVYPFTVGDIKITSFEYTLGLNQIMPMTLKDNVYFGDCSFKFQK